VRHPEPELAATDRWALGTAAWRGGQEEIVDGTEMAFESVWERHTDAAGDHPPDA